MPSATILSEKQKYVADLAEQLKSAVAGVIVDYRGINVADDTALRKELREAGVKYTVVKNTMLRLAAREAVWTSKACWKALLLWPPVKTIM